MRPATMLQELLRKLRYEPEVFGFQDGFVLDELRRQRKHGLDMSPVQVEKVQELYQQYNGTHAAS